MTLVLFAGKAKKKKHSGKGEARGRQEVFRGSRSQVERDHVKHRAQGRRGHLRARGTGNTFPTSARTSLDRLPLYCSPRDHAPAWLAEQATALPHPVRWAWALRAVH